MDLSSEETQGSSYEAVQQAQEAIVNQLKLQNPGLTDEDMEAILTSQASSISSTPPNSQGTAAAGPSGLRTSSSKKRLADQSLTRSGGGGIKITLDLTQAEPAPPAASGNDKGKGKQRAPNPR